MNQQLGERVAREKLHVEACGRRPGNQGWVGDCSQVDEACAVPIGGANLFGQGERDRGLAHAAGADDGQEIPLSHAIGEFGDELAAANQAAEPRGQSEAGSLLRRAGCGRGARPLFPLARARVLTLNRGDEAVAAPCHVDDVA